MELPNVISQIPKFIGEMISAIYCVNKNGNIAYKVTYTGTELKVLAKTTYQEWLAAFPVPNFDTLSANGNYVDAINAYVYTATFEDYQIIILCNCQKEKVEGTTEASTKYTLLVADDSPVITKFFTKTFESDFNILVASDGNEAIKLIEENIDNNLVGAFIDLQMPVKTGYEVLEYMKEHNLYVKVPISVISGEDTEDGIKRATAYGIVDMLQKPFNAEAARSIVNKTISFSPNYKVSEI